MPVTSANALLTTPLSNARLLVRRVTGAVWIAAQKEYLYMPILPTHAQYYILHSGLSCSSRSYSLRIDCLFKFYCSRALRFAPRFNYRTSPQLICLSKLT